jgi:hypothetical protein
VFFLSISGISHSQWISQILAEVSPAPEIVAVNGDAPLRGLLHVTINAILYATSAGVAPEFRLGAVLPRDPFHKTPPIFSSEAVYFLPGRIEISQVRKLQALERVGSGRQILHRFMVRGRWRRAAAVWKDQSVRWIKPYWGPDMAAAVERAYERCQQYKHDLASMAVLRALLPERDGDFAAFAARMDAATGRRP